MASHFGVGAPPSLVYSGDWDVHWGATGLLTHGQVASETGRRAALPAWQRWDRIVGAAGSRKQGELLELTLASNRLDNSVAQNSRDFHMDHKF